MNVTAALSVLYETPLDRVQVNGKLGVRRFSKFSSLFISKKKQFSALAQQLLELNSHIGRIENREERKIAQKKLKKIYKKIRREFIKKAHATSVSDRIRANDLLEAYTTAFRKESIIQARRITKAEIKTAPHSMISTLFKRAPWKPGKKAVLLAEYQKLAELVSNTESSKQELAQLIKAEKLSIEKVTGGKLLDIIYKRRFSGRKQLESLITALASSKYASDKQRSAAQTISFFNSLHIDLWMDIQNDIYSFSELFGYSIHEAKSYNESFGRSLLETAKEKILTPFLTFREKVRARCGETAQVICANAFSRVSIMPLQQGETQRLFPIRGKVFGTQPEKTPQQKSQFLFSVQDLLSATPCKDMTPEKKQLCSLERFLQKYPTYMMVQRLSPSDIHHFYATADATVVNPAQWTDTLSDYDTDYRTASPVSDKEKQVLQEQGTTINIEGTTVSSVNPKAVRQDSSILATNDRKVMLVRHHDGSIAVHIFVGAMNVNHVEVTAQEDTVTAGTSFGRMLFGSERTNSWIHSVRKALSFRRRKHTEGVENMNKIAIAETQCEFGIRGSTVISFYLQKDYKLAPQVQSFLEAPLAQDSTGQSVEIQCRLGDVLAVPVEYEP